MSAINEHFEEDENNSDHVHHDDIVDPTIIYTSPEPEWDWSYEFP